MARKLPRAHEGIPKELDDYLTPAEKIVFRTRLHWIRLVGPWVLFFAVLILVAVLDAKVPADSSGQNGSSSFGLRDLLLIAVALVLVRALWRTYEWYREWFVGTDRRLMLTLGIVTRKVAMIPLGKVTDMRYDRPPLGQILGYGSFVLESAGQDQAFRVVQYVPNPGQLYRTISEELFSPGGRRGAGRPTPVARALPVQEPSVPWWRRS